MIATPYSSAMMSGGGLPFQAAPRRHPAAPSRRTKKKTKSSTSDASVRSSSPSVRSMRSAPSIRRTIKSTNTAPVARPSTSLTEDDRMMQDLMSLWPGAAPPPTKSVKLSSASCVASSLMSAPWSSPPGASLAKSRASSSGAPTSPTTKTVSSSWSTVSSLDDDHSSWSDEDVGAVLRRSITEEEPVVVTKETLETTLYSHMERLQAKLEETEKLLGHASQFVAARLSSGNKMGVLISTKKLLKHKAQKQHLLQVLSELQDLALQVADTDDNVADQITLQSLQAQMVQAVKSKPKAENSSSDSSSSSPDEIIKVAQQHVKDCEQRQQQQQ